MKKILAGLFAGLILAMGAQALAYECADGACELPQRQNTAYCYGGDDTYCDGDRAQTPRGERADQSGERRAARGGCCWCERGR